MAIILIGRSGSGKTTIASRLVTDYDFTKIRSCTTRPQSERDNSSDYQFLSEEEFQDRITKDQFVEWDEYAGHLYGTLKQSFTKHPYLVHVMTPKGATRAKQLFPEDVMIIHLTATLKTSVLRAVGRESYLTPEKLQEIVDRANVDENIYQKIVCDLEIDNDKRRLNTLVKRIDREYENWRAEQAAHRIANAVRPLLEKLKELED